MKRLGGFGMMTRLKWVGWALWWLLIPSLWGFGELELSVTNGTQLRIQHPANTNFYHVLMQGDRPDVVRQPVAVHGPTNGVDVFAGVLEPGVISRFFRVHRYHVQLPGDQDGDGIDDLFELRYPSVLNPLDPKDAAKDDDGDGLNNRDEAHRGLDPTVPNPATILATSPANGEVGVAVTRETVFRLSQPLAPGAMITSAELSATAGGRPLLSRPDLSSDRRTVSLFYLENLPGHEVVTVRFRGNGLKLASGLDLDADGNGQPGGTNVVAFRTLGIIGDPSTAISGVVYDSAKLNGTNRPLAGVTISVDGAEDTLRTVTDARGRFTLSPCPAGRFFVHVDGRTAALSSWPAGDYYPFIGKAWQALAGSRDNLATPTGEIFLPQIRQGTLQSVASGTATRITFPPAVLAANPALTGVSVTVPANSLFADNGTRGGRVGIAPVPPDRLPEPLPGGLRFPLVITVQTDGPGNFDQPVPVQFPNLPDPTTGKTPGPGEKSALWSFNHDTGIWEFQGTMTISADGRFAISDVGVGIRQPGWHGVAPGSPPTPPPTPAPEPPEDDTPCPGEDPYPQVWNLVLEAAKCASKLVRADNVITGVVDIIQGLTGALRSGYQMILVGQSNPGEILPLLQPLLGSISGQKQTLIGIVEAVNTVNPADEFLDAINCVLGIAKSLQALDCALTCRASDPDCIALVNELTAAQDLVAIADAWATGTGELTLLCVALDQLYILTGFIPPNSSIQPPLRDRARPTANSDVDRDKLNALLNQIETETTRLIQAWSNRLVAIETLQRIVPPLLDRASKAIWESGAFLGSLVQVTGSDGTVFRGRIGEDGILPLPVAVPQVTYRVSVYEPVNGDNAWCQYTGPVVGTTFTIPTPVPGTLPGAENPADSDQDGLPDYAEPVAGTDPRRADTDDDGLGDLVEIRQGTNPLFAENGSLRPIAALDTPGDARGVVVLGNVAVVADGPAGISVIDISQLAAPVLLGRLDTAGFARSVAGEGTRCAVADGTNGLAIIDISTPTSPRLVRQTPLPGSASVVVVHDGFAYVGVGTSGVAVVDLTDGGLVQLLNIPFEFVDDLAFVGNRLYVLTQSALEIREPVVSGLRRIGQYPIPVGFRVIPNSIPSRSLSVVNQYAYVGYLFGYFVLDVTDPTTPVLVGSPPVTQSTTHDLKPAAGNILLTLTSFGDPSTLALTTYDASQPADTTAFIATRLVGGEPHALVEYRGHALIANGPAGLQITRFFQPDADDEEPVPFTLNLPATVASGRTLRWQPQFGSNRRVSRVELRVDGAITTTANEWPFELVWNVPVTTVPRTVSLSARVFGFGSAVATNTPVNVIVEPSAVRPVLVSQDPPADSTLPLIRRLTWQFDQPLDPAAVTSAGVTLRYFGPDGIAGTADDTQLSPGTVRLLPGNRLLRIESFGALPAGEFELRIDPSILVTPAGERSPGPLTTRFRRSQPAPTVEWINDQDGDWNNPANWSPARIPGASDIVLIDRPAASPTITLGSAAGAVTVAALTCRERFRLAGGDLTVAGTYQSELTGDVVTSGAATFRANRNTLLILAGLTQSSATFVAGIGGQFEFDPSEGVIELPNLTAASSSGSVTFNARPGSRVAAPKFRNSSQGLLTIEAVGGEVSLDALGPDSSQRFNLRVSDQGVIRLPSLRRLNGLSSRDSFMSAGTGGVIETPGVETAAQLRAFINDADANWNVPGLSHFGDGELSYSGGTRNLTMLTASNTIFSAKAGARVSFLRLTNSTGSGFPAFTASEGSQLNFAVLQTLAGPFSGIFPASFTFRASSGSQIQLPALEATPTGRLLFIAEGANSLVRLPAIRQFGTASSGSASTLEASAGGRVETPQLVRLQNTLALARNAGSIQFNTNLTFNTNLFFNASSGFNTNLVFIADGAEVRLEATGTLLCGPLGLDTGGILSGTGKVPAPVLNGGIVRPGDAFTVGKLTLTGGYRQLPPGRLELKLNGIAAAQRDQVVVMGLAAFDGTLAVTRGSGFSYASGQRFPVIQYIFRVGDFATRAGLTQGAVTLQTVYSETALELVGP